MNTTIWDANVEVKKECEDHFDVVRNPREALAYLLSQPVISIADGETDKAHRASFFCPTALAPSRARHDRRCRSLGNALGSLSYCYCDRTT
ncbi:hypothetical protein [Pararhizobium sp. PWRC1-1]|uniref:hypothetical protein n=1 Tax=Pararhizobium sp. PWRC1-1 TaxID=2804566 RepID=UPI003CF4F766